MAMGQTYRRGVALLRPWAWHCHAPTLRAEEAKDEGDGALKSRHAEEGQGLLAEGKS